MNVVASVNRFKPQELNVGLSLFVIWLITNGPDIIMHQLKSIYNSPFKESHSHPVHTCFAMIASNVTIIKFWSLKCQLEYTFSTGVFRIW